MVLPERPKWLETALQGLAYWMGHRQSLFRTYPLTEGAMVAEACNLIFANLSPELVILPERMYRDLVRPEGNPFQGKLTRADLVICDKTVNQNNVNANISVYVKYVIEVKRGSASNQLIDEDLKRLCQLKNAGNTDIRCFLFVISEGHAPKRFVNNGKSIKGWNEIQGCSGYYRVRRTVKASPSFSNKERAHYVCMIEVFQSRILLKKVIKKEKESNREVQN